MSDLWPLDGEPVSKRRLHGSWAERRSRADMPAVCWSMPVHHFSLFTAKDGPGLVTRRCMSLLRCEREKRRYKGIPHRRSESNSQMDRLSGSTCPLTRCPYGCIPHKVHSLRTGHMCAHYYEEIPPFRHLCACVTQSAPVRLLWLLVSDGYARCEYLVRPATVDDFTRRHIEALQDHLVARGKPPPATAKTQDRSSRPRRAYLRACAQRLRQRAGCLKQS